MTTSTAASGADGPGMIKQVPGPQGLLESRLAKQHLPRGPPRLDMSIVLGIKRENSEVSSACEKRARPPFWPCCVCNTNLDLALPVHVCDTCRKTHCSGCGTWLVDGSRKCTNCLAGAGCNSLVLATAAPAQSTAQAGQTAYGVRQYSRGHVDQITAITCDPSAIKAARAEFDHAVFADSSKSSNLSRARTWAKTSQLLKVSRHTLTPEGIHQVMSVLRQAGYRSAKLILSQAKSDFIREGGTWTAQLDQAAREANRAADRDLGPPQQSCPFPVELIHTLPGGEKPRIEGGPAFPRRVDVVSCFFALRGAEIIAARAQNVSKTAKGISMCLSKTKTDPGALGTTRTHICACPASRGSESLVRSETCPACNTWEQASWALASFGNNPETPLFPTPQGKQISKTALVQHLEAAFKHFNLPTRGHGGGRSVGEHSCRNGIAVFLASRGVPVWQIQGLLRHSAAGQTVLRYIREAHVHASTNLAEEAEMGRDLEAMRRKMVALTSESKMVEQNIRATLDKAIADSKARKLPQILLDEEDLQVQELPGEDQLALEDAASTSAQAASSSTSQEGHGSESTIYVLSTQPGGRGVTHILNLRQPDRTKCGWPFLRTRWHALTNNPLCDPQTKGVVETPPGGCRPICKLCLG